MVNNYKSGIAKEPLTNYTICIRDSDGIRKMKNQNDCMNNLVFISQIAPRFTDEVGYIIPTGECVRYIDVVIKPKPEIY